MGCLAGRYSWYIGFPFQAFRRLLHTHRLIVSSCYPSSWASTMGERVDEVPSGLSPHPIPPHPTPLSLVNNIIGIVLCLRNLRFSSPTVHLISLTSSQLPAPSSQLRVLARRWQFLWLRAVALIVENRKSRSEGCAHALCIPGITRKCTPHTSTFRNRGHSAGCTEVYIIKSWIMHSLLWPMYRSPGDRPWRPVGL
jgi:hypothetical protein